MPFVVFALLAAAPVQLASLELTASNAPPETARSLSNTLASRMSDTGLVRVTTPADIAAALGVERQRQLLGCNESTCLAELAGALGARGIVTGELARIGEVFQLTVRVLDSGTVAPIFSVIERRQSLEALLIAVDQVASDAARSCARHFGTVARRLNVGPVVGLSVGAAGLAVAGVLLGLAGADHAALVSKRPASFAEAQQVAARGNGTQLAGLVTLAIAGVVAIGGLVWLLVAPEQDVPVALEASSLRSLAWGSW